MSENLETNLSKEDLYAKYFEGSHWILPTDLSVVEPAAQELERRLALIPTAWKEMGIFRATFGLRELLANAIAHGNLAIKGPIAQAGPQIEALRQTQPELFQRTVEVRLDLSETEAIITVKDQGAGFDFAAVANPTAPDNLLAPSGRGLFYFFNHPAYELKYDNSVAGTTAILRVKNPDD